MFDSAAQRYAPPRKHRDTIKYRGARDLPATTLALQAAMRFAGPAPNVPLEPPLLIVLGVGPGLAEHVVP